MPAYILRIILICLLCYTVFPPCHGLASASYFGVSTSTLPVFNKPGSAGAGVKTGIDRCGQARDLEFIALPGTVFRVIREAAGSPEVVQVTTAEYPTPPGTTLYVASRQLKHFDVRPADRDKRIPDSNQVIQLLRSATGLPYIWGGNARNGVELNGELQFKGLDCSGLLYEATNGYTPRNTSHLVSFGTAVSITGLTPAEIAGKLHPLDLIVWDGHLVIVLDRVTTIESILQCRSGRKGGVVQTPLVQRLQQISRYRKPYDEWPVESRAKAKSFVIRRWLKEPAVTSEIIK